MVQSITKRSHKTIYEDDIRTIVKEKFKCFNARLETFKSHCDSKSSFNRKGFFLYFMRKENSSCVSINFSLILHNHMLIAKSSYAKLGKYVYIST